MDELSRYEKRKQATKQRIAEAALALFKDYGFEQTTMEQIAEKADVAKGTLFNHFSSKNNLLTFLGEKRVALIKSTLAANLRQSANAAGSLYAVFDSLAAVNDEDRAFGPLLLHDFMYRYTFGERTHYEEAASSVRAILQQGIDSGELRAGFDLEQAISLLGGVYYHTTVDWVRAEYAFSIRDAFRSQLDLILTGIRS